MGEKTDQQNSEDGLFFRSDLRDGSNYKIQMFLLMQ